MNQKNRYIKDSYLKPHGSGSIKKIIFLIAGLLLTHPVEKIVSSSKYEQERILYNQFDEKLFEKDVHQIAQETKKSLLLHFPGHRWTVKIVQIKRSLIEQEKLLKKGLSQTGLGLHQLGAACDFEIRMDGQKVTGTGRPKGGLVESVEPYRILGGIAKKYGYFWGLPWDSGHVASERYVSDFLIYNPKYLEHPDVVRYYRYLSRSKTIDIKYQKFIELMDSQYGVHESRSFVGELNVDELLTPID